MALNYISNIQLAILNFLIYVDSKSVLYALQNWNCKVRRDIVYEVKHLNIVSCLGMLGLSFVGYDLSMVITGMKYQIN